jgi:hypothetical protein
MAVNVHVENLVLHGFDPRDGDAIGDALRAELARAIGGAPLASRDRIDGGEFRLADRRAVATAAREIATAVGKAVRR